MCGIAGILSTEGRALDWRPRALAMQHRLAHRGPDGRGDWTSPCGHAVFAHTRLAIVDRSPGGRQPMSIDDGRVTMVMNGAIYNFQELRRELERRGATFRTRTDTEVVLRAYDAFGEGCVERLRGMFALVLWDARERRALLARDRFGIKPLYYAEQPGRLVFASETRALVASGLVPPAVDARAVQEYFRAGSVQEPRTLLAGARTLEGGHVATWRHGHLRTRRYWDLSFASDLRDDEAVESTRAALVDSIQHHFIGDVPAGVFLSGGIDSTALLALARPFGPAGMRAVTMSIPGSEADELTLARRTATHFDVPHDVCSVDAAAGRALFADYVNAMDQPSIDGMNTLAVARAAASAGLTVMLSGIGADELFGGYPSARSVPAFERWRRRLSAAGPARTAAGRLLGRAADPRWRRVGDLLGQRPSLGAAYAMFRGIFTRSEARALTEHYTGLAPAMEEGDTGGREDPTPQDGVCRLEMTRYLRNQLLRDTDVMGMAAGVEIRLPFLDAGVVDAVTRVAARTRLEASKSLLRRAVPEMPPWVAQQPKRGFMFPIESWQAGEWRGLLDARDPACPVVGGPWYRQWCVAAFEEWRGRLQAAPARPPVVSQVANG